MTTLLERTARACPLLPDALPWDLLGEAVQLCDASASYYGLNKPVRIELEPLISSSSSVKSAVNAATIYIPETVFHRLALYFALMLEHFRVKQAPRIMNSPFDMRGPEHYYLPEPFRPSLEDYCDEEVFLKAIAIAHEAVAPGKCAVEIPSLISHAFANIVEHEFAHVCRLHDEAIAAGVAENVARAISAVNAYATELCDFSGPSGPMALIEMDADLMQGIRRAEQLITRLSAQDVTPRGWRLAGIRESYALCGLLSIFNPLNREYDPDAPAHLHTTLRFEIVTFGFEFYVKKISDAPLELRKALLDGHAYGWSRFQVCASSATLALSDLDPERATGSSPGRTAAVSSIMIGGFFSVEVWSRIAVRRKREAILFANYLSGFIKPRGRGAVFEIGLDASQSDTRG